MSSIADWVWSNPLTLLFVVFIVSGLATVLLLFLLRRQEEAYQYMEARRRYLADLARQEDDNITGV